MKKILLLLAVASLSLSSCVKSLIDDLEDDEDDDPIENGGGGGGILDESSLSASVGGSSWTASYVIGRVDQANGYKILTILGNKGGESISISVSKYSGTGSYSSTGANDPYLIIQYIDKNGNGYSSYTEGGNASATITTANSSRVKGSFSFSGKNLNGSGSIKVSNGTFDVSL